MQVQCTNPGTKAVRPAAFPGVEVRFSKNGFAAVTDEVGEFLVRHYPAIVTKVKARRTQRTKVNEQVEPVVIPTVDLGSSETSDVGTQKEGE